MTSFEDLLHQFETRFSRRHFPVTPATLYDPAEYILGIGGKRIRPVLCLMGNELFDDIRPDAFEVATALELFHNFTLIHDDIMDKAPLRRGQATVHAKYGENSALLAGDVMLTMAYEYLNKIDVSYLRRIVSLFNRTVFEVSEGQQLDMDYEQRTDVTLDEYLHMITLKTSVLLACALQTGALLGGASQGNADLLYQFGKHVGIAFQVQDDYLDAFGDPAKFGKQVGGDIIANKKTFLLLHTQQTASAAQTVELAHWMAYPEPAAKVAGVLGVMRACGADAWAAELKARHTDLAMQYLEDVAVLSNRKEPLRAVAAELLQRQR
ncbi:polyprenyl synthetase family protein [Dinghuibacter silviterrae]|uniref:Geranylgeranyl diphosphate synthase type II n=1 Tax=Dinghuibacter silviterrae TaxID=1539049 RepID=A0A4R8DJ75_9BACT|nr:polyprenyl synthetase family protein [Dinghuibacter silviterrae]TDW97568.1 geranylgeranyl diphosphate synthase type II [Dinghuibacter silviterrae]